VNLKHSRSLFELFFEFLLFCCALFSIALVLVLIAVLGWESLSFFREVPINRFLFDLEWTPLFAQKNYGILPLLLGTLQVTIVALAVALLPGLLIAVYMSEYSSDNVRRLIKPLLEILAGIPTVIYGYFALLTVTPMLQKLFPGMAGFNALSPGIVLGLMVLPLVTSLSEDALRGVSFKMKESALALGASRLQACFHVVIPAALPGIVSSFLLAFSRAIGETMIVTIAAGQSPRLGVNLFEPLQTMTAYIVQVSMGDVPAGSIEYRTIFIVGGVLFLFTLVINMINSRLWSYRRGSQR